MPRSFAEFSAARRTPNLAADLRLARQIAVLLDAQFEVAGIRFGIDAIIGLVPVLGDFLGALSGIYPLIVVHRHKLGWWVAIRMIWNLVFEFLIGAIPILGDFFDVAFKANLRNLAILEKAAAKRVAREGAVASAAAG